MASPTTGGLCRVLRAKRERDAVLSGEGPRVLGAERRREGPGPFRIVQEFSLDHLWWGMKSLRGGCSQLTRQRGVGQRCA